MATKSTHFTNSATEKTRPFAEWWRRSQGAGATRQMPASHLRARGCLHQWHRQQPAGGPNAFNQQNGWPSNIGPRHLDQSKGKSSCFFLHVIQLLMDCVWRSWQDSAVEPPKAPWKQGGLVGERPTMPRYQDWTKCASRLQVGSVKSQERDHSMIANDGKSILGTILMWWANGMMLKWMGASCKNIFGVCKALSQANHQRMPAKKFACDWLFQCHGHVP